MKMDADQLLARKDDLYLKVPGRFCYVLYALLGAGFLGLVLGLIFDPVRTWGSFLFNLFFFFSLALGGIAFTNMQAIIGALWGRTLHRMHESFAAFLPVATVFFFIFLTCVHFDIFSARSVYSWVKDPELIVHFPGKNIWLSFGAMYWRDLISLVIIVAVAFWHLRLTTGRDLAAVALQKEAAQSLARAAHTKLKFWSGGVLVVYTLCFTVLAFDLMMSLAPTWFSTLWAGWLFAIMMQTLMAFSLLWMFFLKTTPLASFLRRQQFHDIGKAMFGFTIFFAYLSYAHVLTYWYANMPEETSYYITRLKAPWLHMVISIPFVCWLLPMFILIPKASKWEPKVAIPVSLLVLGAQWMTLMLVVIPELVPGHWSYPLTVELSLLAFFFSLFMLTVLRFAQKVPFVAIGDPLLLKAFEHH